MVLRFFDNRTQRMGFDSDGCETSGSEEEKLNREALKREFAEFEIEIQSRLNPMENRMGRGGFGQKRGYYNREDHMGNQKGNKQFGNRSQSDPGSPHIVNDIQEMDEDPDTYQIYFWSLPSCAENQLRQKQSKLEDELAALKRRRTELEKQKESSKKGKEDSSEREKALAILKQLEKEHKMLKDELELYVDNDPATFEAMKAATEVAHQAANRWIDNVFSMQNWCSNNFPEAKERLQQAYKEVGITEDFDYIQ